MVLTGSDSSLYLGMLQSVIDPLIVKIVENIVDKDIENILQQCGAPPHLAIDVRNYLFIKNVESGAKDMWNGFQDHQI